MKFSNEKNKGWTLILISAVCEIIWAICIDFTQGLRVMTWNAVVVLFLAISVVLLSMSIKTGINLSTAYAVWTGIGIVGTVVISAIMGLDVITAMTMVGLVLIIAGSVGLKTVD